ncbi:MAG: hypothetical protein ABI972_10925 [Acidobacteriota bacterium]
MYCSRLCGFVAPACNMREKYQTIRAWVTIIFDERPFGSPCMLKLRV